MAGVSPPFDPVFTRAELDELCLPPTERLRRAAVGGPAAVESAFRAMTVHLRDIATLYARWSAVTVQWLHSTHGVDAAARCFPVTELWPPSVVLPTDRQAALAQDVLGGSGSRSLALLAEASGPSELVARWEEIHAACYLVETLRRDTVTAYLTLVNAEYGADGLEACLRYATDIIWMPRMALDLAQPPPTRLRAWAEKMAVGHNGSVHVTEHADRWVLTLDPCGSCGRQILAGRYAPPWNFGIVADGHPVGFHRPDITVYQAHIAVAHSIVPIERTGAEWPAIQCAGLTARPCHLTIPK
jgi:hypothetical protein